MNFAFAFCSFYRPHWSSLPGEFDWTVERKKAFSYISLFLRHTLLSKSVYGGPSRQHGLRLSTMGSLSSSLEKWVLLFLSLIQVVQRGCSTGCQRRTLQWQTKSGLYLKAVFNWQRSQLTAYLWLYGLAAERQCCVSLHLLISTLQPFFPTFFLPIALFLPRSLALPPETLLSQL